MHAGHQSGSDGGTLSMRKSLGNVFAWDYPLDCFYRELTLAVQYCGPGDSVRDGIPAVSEYRNDQLAGIVPASESDAMLSDAGCFYPIGLSSLRTEDRIRSWLPAGSDACAYSGTCGCGPCLRLPQTGTPDTQNSPVAGQGTAEDTTGEYCPGSVPKRIAQRIMGAKWNLDPDSAGPGTDFLVRSGAAHSAEYF